MGFAALIAIGSIMQILPEPTRTRAYDAVEQATANVRGQKEPLIEIRDLSQIQRDHIVGFLELILQRRNPD